MAKVRIQKATSIVPTKYQQQLIGKATRERQKKKKGTSLILATGVNNKSIVEHNQNSIFSPAVVLKPWISLAQRGSTELNGSISTKRKALLLRDKAMKVWTNKRKVERRKKSSQNPKFLKMSLGSILRFSHSGLSTWVLLSLIVWEGKLFRQPSIHLFRKTFFFLFLSN